jgi:hypothetical protein
MIELESRLLELRVELLEAEVSRQKAPKPTANVWSSPLLLAIVGATITAVVGLITSQSQLAASRQLERDKLESSLILKAIDSDDPNERIASLQFLVKADLISDRNKRIESLKPSEVPQIRSQVPTNIAEPDPSAAALLDQLDSPTRDVRISATSRLIKQYATSAEVLQRAVEKLEQPKLEKLSASGRINVLVFLRNTNEVAWSADTIKRARAAIANIRSRKASGVEIGNQTEEALRRLEEHLNRMPERNQQQ